MQSVKRLRGYVSYFFCHTKILIINEKINATANQTPDESLAAFGYGGQKCSATSRVYVESSVNEMFIRLLVERTEQIKIGDPTERPNFLGPVINKAAFDKYQRAVDLAKKDGHVITGGNVLTDGNLGSGYFVQPTIITDLPKEHSLLKEELFLPIVCITTVESFSEALNHANRNEYGLTAGIFSEDKGEVQRFLDGIQAGVVYVNRKSSATTGATVNSQPFVGWKLSGSTGKGAGGEHYLQQFLREQSQTVVE